jgi:hypothetical protein
LIIEKDPIVAKRRGAMASMSPDPDISDLEFILTQIRVIAALITLMQDEPDNMTGFWKPIAYMILNNVDEALGILSTD